MSGHRSPQCVYIVLELLEVTVWLTPSSITCNIRWYSLKCHNHHLHNGWKLCIVLLHDQSYWPNKLVNGGHCGDLIGKFWISRLLSIIIMRCCTNSWLECSWRRIWLIVTFLSHNLVVLFSEFCSGLDVKVFSQWLTTSCFSLKSANSDFTFPLAVLQCFKLMKTVAMDVPSSLNLVVNNQSIHVAAFLCAFVQLCRSCGIFCVYCTILEVLRQFTFWVSIGSAMVFTRKGK